MYSKIIKNIACLTGRIIIELILKTPYLSHFFKSHMEYIKPFSTNLMPIIKLLSILKLFVSKINE